MRPYSTESQEEIFALAKGETKRKEGIVYGRSTASVPDLIVISGRLARTRRTGFKRGNRRST
jgi:hypothetical protein